MRTGGQGQAAVLRESGPPKGARGCLDGDPGPVGEDPADCHRFVERYPEAFPAGACRSGEGVWLAMGAFRVHGFLFARMWAVRAWNESNGGK